MQVLLASCAASRGAASSTESDCSGVLGLSLFGTPSALAVSFLRDRETERLGSARLNRTSLNFFTERQRQGSARLTRLNRTFLNLFRKVFFQFSSTETFCSRGKRRHRVPRLATSQLVGFILGYHSGRLRVLLLVASPLQTRVLVQSVVLPLRQHFGLRHHWLKRGDVAAMEPLKPGSNANAEGVRGDSQDPSGVPVPGNPAGSGSILGSLTAKTSKTPGETAGEGRPTRGRLATDSLSMPPVPAPAAQTPPESTLLRV